MFFERLLCAHTLISLFSPRQPWEGVFLPFSLAELLRRPERVLRAPAPGPRAGLSDSTQSDFPSRLLSSRPRLAWWPAAPTVGGAQGPQGWL